MLWDIIRDFFAQYIFGGITSYGDVYGGVVGSAYKYYSSGGDEFTEPFGMVYSNNYGFKYNGFVLDDYYFETYISIGDWLSTTATIITLCAICVFLFFFVRWLFRLTAGLISGRG